MENIKRNLACVVRGKFSGPRDFSGKPLLKPEPEKLRGHFQCGYLRSRVFFVLVFFENMI